MTDTPHLALPLLAAAQAQKHVTHNEALALIDALVHLAVKERDRTGPPGAPAEGDRYIVGSGAAGAFAGREGQVALFDLGAWRFLAPKPGWRAYAEADGSLLVFDGMAWRDLGQAIGEADNLDHLGIGTAADPVNRLAAKLNAALFTALPAGEGGTGDLRFVLNKEVAGGVLSQLYQSGYSGRAETGLVGGDDFSIRVSADGGTWREALRIDRATGAVAFPSGAAGLRDAGNLLINPEASVNQRGFAGGALAAGAYGFDRWKGGPGGCTVTRAADGTLTLTGALTQVVELPDLAGRTVCLSVENPTAPVSVSVAGIAGVIAAGPGRRAVALAVPSGATGDVTVTLSGSAVSFARPLLNLGPAAAPFERLSPGATLALCQRYFAKTFAPAIAPAGNAGTGGALVGHAPVANAIPTLRWQYPVPMRAVPVLAFYNPVAANGQWSVGGVDAAASATVPTTADAAAIGVQAGATPTLAAGALTAIHVTADAEL
ncbi:MAG TPA: DUF2793 domain-containing protein [Microvirga sp.]|jgi:hypothetical protein|nr:DUF2793 domain-containing protein [Microvirga sp.]